VRGELVHLKLLPSEFAVMPLRLGEREIIRMLTGIYGKGPKLPLGYDDDVAAVPISQEYWLIVKSDMLIGSTDVPRGMSLRQAARKAVVATVSDFAAKGVKPRALMVSLGLPPSFGRKELNQIGKGLDDGSREYDCRIIGGDTGESQDLTVDCIGVGVAEPSRIVRRDGATPGDVVAVTGNFGNSAAGLRLLLSGRRPFTSAEQTLAKAALLPRARLDEGLLLAKHGLVSSSIDSSDGLAWSLHEIARLSGVSIGLDKVPVSREVEGYARQNRTSPIELALYGGEEYELVVTLKPNLVSKARRLVPTLIPIGRVGKGPPRVGASIGGRLVQVERRGWEHFKSRVRFWE
jgi:thiamine-monophosphate kinase